MRKGGSNTAAGRSMGCTISLFRAARSMISRMRRLRSACVLAVLICCLLPCSRQHAAFAQAAPARLLTLVVPLGAGGAMDTIIRLMGPRLSERLGQAIVVENRT